MSASLVETVDIEAPVAVAWALWSDVTRWPTFLSHVRLVERLDEPEKRWKFRKGDLDDRALWDDYQQAFHDALATTSTDDAPWYVVPGNRKWVRNLVVAEILHHHLKQIDPHFPPVEDGTEGIVVE